MTSRNGMERHPITRCVSLSLKRHWNSVVSGCFVGGGGGRPSVVLALVSAAAEDASTRSRACFFRAARRRSGSVVRVVRRRHGARRPSGWRRPAAPASLDVRRRAGLLVRRRTAGDRSRCRARRVQVAVRRRLGAAGEVFGVDHRPALELAVVVDDLDVARSLRSPACPTAGRPLAVTMPAGGVNHSGLSSSRRGLHELRPDRHRDVGGEAVRQNRARLIEPDPDAGRRASA